MHAPLQPAAGDARRPLPYLLGTVGMLASPALLLDVALNGFGTAGFSGGLLNAIYSLGWGCSVAGLWHAGALGHGRTSRVVFGVEMAGLVLAFAWAALLMAGSSHETGGTLFRVTDMAWPASVAFMLVVGGVTVRAGRWTGWRRFTPLLCGLGIPVGLLIAVAAGPEAMRRFGAAHFFVAWLLLGYAVRTAGRARFGPARTHGDVESAQPA